MLAGFGQETTPLFAHPMFPVIGCSGTLRMDKEIFGVRHRGSSLTTMTASLVLMASLLLMLTILEH